jgi:hypothetical protein
MQFQFKFVFVCVNNVSMQILSVDAKLSVGGPIKLGIDFVQKLYSSVNNLSLLLEKITG